MAPRRSRALAAATGRTLAFQEGGYDPDASASVSALDDVTVEPEAPTTDGLPRDVVAVARRIHTETARGGR